MTVWADLPPGFAMLEVLAAADDTAPRTEVAGRVERNKWSNRVADACAVTVARAVHAEPLVRRLESGRTTTGRAQSR